MEESGLAIKKTYRVKRSKDFEQIFSARHSFANRKFVVYTLNAEQSHYRVGISVSKKNWDTLLSEIVLKGSFVMPLRSLRHISKMLILWLLLEMVYRSLTLKK